MATLTPELVTFLFGKEWLPSIPVMQILTFSGIIHTLSYFNASVFMAMGKPSWRLWLSFIEALFSIVACLFAVQWGIVAVALAYVISIYLVFPISQAAVSKLIHVPILIYLQQFMTSLMASTVMATAILMTKYFLVNFLDAKFILLIGTMIGIIVYSLTIRLIDPKLFQYVWELFRIVFSKKKPNLLKS
jgi:PST family polysaccharide transporter